MRSLRSALFSVAASALSITLGVTCAHASTVVRFEFNVGSVDVRLFEDATPNSVANFLNYSTSNRYDGTFIHRVPQLPTGGTSNFVVQGGGFQLNNSIFAATGISTDAPIGDEPGITNIRGSLAFAKNSLGATSQWFFNIGDNSFLDDQDFTVFGRVVNDGMTIVDGINNLTAVNASVAENASGEDFDEIPVFSLAQVQVQGDITNADAVLLNNVAITSFADGDYNFDGRVDAADYTVWRRDLGSTILAEADGNGNGIVDEADFFVWRASYGQAGGPAAAIASLTVPEPTSLLLTLLGGLALLGRRRR